MDKKKLIKVKSLKAILFTWRKKNADHSQFKKEWEEANAY